MNAPFLILQTGQPVASLRRHRGFPHWIRVAAGLRADEAVVVDVEAGAALPSRDGFAGTIVTGSAAMVTDRAEWSERSAAWLHDAAHAGMPLLGICYGHQLLAHALGGEVGDHPGGREMGTHTVERLDAAQGDALLRDAPARFSAQLTHRQSVLEAPAEAVVLARSAHDECQAFRIGARTWGVQFHPEFSTAAMRGYIAARGDDLRREATCPRTLAHAVHAAPHARAILRRFARLSLSGSDSAG